MTNKQNRNEGNGVGNDMKRTFKFCSGFPAHRFPFAWKKIGEPKECRD